MTHTPEQTVLPTPDMQQHYTEEFLENYAISLEKISRSFGSTPSYDADSLFKVMSLAWIAGRENRPLVAADFERVTYHGSNADRSPARLIKELLSGHMAGLVAQHDEDFEMYATLYRRFSGMNPNDVPKKEQR